MKKTGLFTKMVAAYILIIAFGFVMLAAFLSLWFKSYYFDQRREQIDSQKIQFSQIVTRYMNNELTVDEVNEDLEFMSNYLKADIWLVDNSGYIYAVSDKDQKTLVRNRLFSEYVGSAEEFYKIDQSERRKKYKEIYKNSVNTVELPVTSSNNEFLGAVIIHTPVSEILNPLNLVYSIIWLSAVFVIIISSIGIYAFSQRTLITPLAQINNVAKKIAKGDVERRVQIQSNDEIGELAKSFNSMADSLEKVEQTRRGFISNVSHEIRTPITSIKGFIGGIIDGIVPENKQKDYLTMAYEETQRLTRLVNDLLDLSALESGKFNQIIDEIDINELIRLTVLKFENKINNKKLKVDVKFDGERLKVLGDRDRIIQVVTNLFDNAIKYSNEEGYIRIRTKTKGKKAVVSFFNTAQQIKEEDLKHIWERFYRCDKARTSKVSSGLGLSIVRGIISQMGEDIWVENKDDGVQFAFTLKKIR